ncbi:MAG: hypothetical protein MR497_00540, partial [Bacilli bacterium]|nr:hypothetical protein [Bacilli bacterium]
MKNFIQIDRERNTSLKRSSVPLIHIIRECDNEGRTIAGCGFQLDPGMVFHDDMFDDGWSFSWILIPSSRTTRVLFF